MADSPQTSGDVYNRPRGGHDSRKPRYDAEPLTVTIEPASKKKSCYDAKQYRLDRHRYRLEKKAYRVACWTLFALAVYTGVTIGLFCISFWSTRITQKAFRAGSAGVVRPEIGIGGHDSITVAFVNKGKGNAYKINARYRLIIQSIPEEKQLWASEWKTAYSEVVQQNEGSNNHTVINGFTTQQWPLFVDTKEVIRAEGSFTYNDGFGNVGPVGFCIMLAANSGNPGMFPCSDLAVYLRSIQR